MAFRRSRLFVLGFGYSLLCAASFWISFDVRFDFMVPPTAQEDRLVALSFVVPLKLFFLWIFGQFRGLLSYFRIPDLNRLFLAMLSANVVLLAVRLLEPAGLYAIPRGVVLADLLFSVVLLAGFRMGLRIAREKFNATPFSSGKKTTRIGIIGAGSTGASLAAEFLAKPHIGVRPVAFFDDHEEKIGRQIHGIPILRCPDDFSEVSQRFGLDKVSLAIPSLNARRIREIIESVRSAKLETTIIPSLHELSSGRVRIEEMRKVEVEDVLGRDPVPLDNEPIRRIVENQVVLVTGAGGSIGSEICRQVASFNPSRLILLDHSELALFTMEQEMRDSETGASISVLVADICDSQMMARVFRRYRPSVIFHAAAYKHVPLMETQPWEAVANNAIGTYQLGGLAVEFGVERFVLISTDKAINPTSVMGATKRLAEIAIQSLGDPTKRVAGRGPATRFMAVRFGNVLGSSGSVIPTFRRQIARGGPVTVTHREVTRYFMTIPEAVGLVLQAASIGEGGEIFLLDMGEPVKIIDLARQMIQLSGFEPETEIEIEITGLRPGEKLFEELNYATESSEETDHSRIRKLCGGPDGADRFEDWIAALEEELIHLDGPALKNRIKEIIPEYQPFVE